MILYQKLWVIKSLPKRLRFFTTSTALLTNDKELEKQQIETKLEELTKERDALIKLITEEQIKGNHQASLEKKLEQIENRIKEMEEQRDKSCFTYKS